ncbi:sigma factor-like helix-turn-helix DNA-binding protein [Chiayiivirga flava]|uniref:DNA-directed RNA polymerase specialized sigma24 family protein n=1 Tax=Chiayiivirga flava TaxID=659595 RepID=A0A7W8D4I3_9GAMM|nr:sigma factor-like helix-turn-helix DNA-binding protein [Chiayiivirga flava]MBB5207791.1 DNA-directed RNA polymerase specialized sigma24 family protein [Chiayiivirga flava]
MPQAASAAPATDTAALDRFLRGLERRALCMAQLALPGHDDAFDAVQDAMAAFVRDRPPAEADWPLPFWRAFHVRLGGAARRRAPWMAWAGPRRRGPDTAADLGADPGAPGTVGSGPFLALADAAAGARLAAALRALPPGERQAFLLRVWENLDMSGIARAMQLSEDAVKAQLSGALRQLRRHLEIAMTTPAAAPPRDDGRWILRSRALLDASARDLDGATLSRLAHARRAAMDGVAPAPPSARPLAWLGGLAMALGIGLMLSRLLPVAQVPGVAPDAAAPSVAPAVAPPPRIAPTEDTPLAAPDFELLVDADDEALLDELAFYVWLGAGGDRDED